MRGLFFVSLDLRVVFGFDGRWSVQDGLHRTAASLLCGFQFILTLTNPTLLRQLDARGSSDELRQ